jgi:hypothetical protein
MLPMSVCELDTGRPMYQVPRFHITPAKSRASTMIRPTRALSAFAWMSRSTGSRLTMPNATPVPPSSTPRKFITPEYNTAGVGGMDRV